MINFRHRLQNSRVFFSKSVKKSIKRAVRVLRVRRLSPGLPLCLQPRSRPFVWLLACTWIRKNTDCFAVYRCSNILAFITRWWTRLLTSSCREWRRSPESTPLESLSTDSRPPFERWWVRWIEPTISIDRWPAGKSSNAETCNYNTRMWEGKT